MTFLVVPVATVIYNGWQIARHREQLFIDKRSEITPKTRQHARLYITSTPSLVKYHKTIPGISVHEMLVIDEDVKPVFHKPEACKALLYKNAEWFDVKETASNLSNNILDHPAESVEINWHSFTVGMKTITSSIACTTKLYTVARSKIGMHTE